MELAEECYKLTESFPRSERFGLTFRIRKSSVSIVSNIPEGYRRRRRTSYVYFLQVASGSEGELDTQLELAIRLRFCTRDQAKRAAELVDEVGRLLYGLLDSLGAYSTP
jgi:four helix bundle protein